MRNAVLPSPWLAASAIACIALLPAAARAQGLPGGVQLDMTVPQLQQAMDVRPVARPARLAGGLVGGWSGAAVDVAGVALTPTFFFAEGQLRRVEYLAAAGAAPGAFDALLDWGRAAWGTELASQSPEGTYATWAAGEMDVYLQQTSAPQGGRVRLVVKRRLLKDGTEL